ncbi:MAG: hypothetical protein WC728_04820 [Elusimicrobiota bacterium]
MKIEMVKGNNRRKYAAVAAKAPEPEERRPGCVVIDFPCGAETIRSDHYTLRIAAVEEGQVEVSLDNGPWQPCRSSQGYWWYDWSGYATGRHRAVARLNTTSGETRRGSEVGFLVEL